MAASRAPWRLARGRLPACLVGGLLCIATTGSSAQPAGAAPAVPPTQQLVELTTSHRVFATPRAGAARRGTLSARRPITGSWTVLPVLGHATAAGGARWLRVRLPGRPNSATGWIQQRGTRATSTSWRIVVRTAARRVRVYRKGRLARSFAVVVGKPATPTPHGHFFVEESVRLLPNGIGGPYALATSARSNVLQEFMGGPGQIALHGVDNLGGTPGTAVSHGCIRLSGENNRWMAARIGPGVPITITR